MRSDFQINFTSLKEGQHVFNFKIDDSFFEQLEYTIIEKGNLEVEMILEKKPTLMNAVFHIKGTVTVMCDRCTDNFELAVETQNELIYKFGSEPMDDESVVVVLPREFEINVQHPIYEFTATSLPLKKLHPKGECNEEMLKIMDQYLLISEDEEE
ncbi:MAG: DUF177 domain-containing protein [Putridiphycobacter sp.]|jgi:uncharacterized protein|nr:DUF177 domain-containing protein [Putridiphycobacter sp.]